MDSVLVVSVREVGASAEQLEVIGELLRDELLGLDVSSVQRLTDVEAPPGSHGLDIAALGGLLVSLPATPALLSALVDLVGGWLGRSRQLSGRRSVRIESDGDVLELSQVSSEDQSRLIDAWLQRRGQATVEANTGDGSK